jgi:hypothetical protein
MNRQYGLEGARSLRSAFRVIDGIRERGALKMGTTTQFFDEICQRGATPDRPFVDANEIAEQLGMNDEDLIAAVEALEMGNLIEEVDRGEQIAVRLTQEGIDIWKQQRGVSIDR